MNIQIVEEEKQQVEEYQTQISFVEEKANELVIETEEHMTVASDILNDLKKIEKAVAEKKKTITRPLMDALANTRNLFKPLEAGYASAKKTINDKMITYSEEQEEKIRKEKERVTDRVSRGTMRVDTAVQKLDEAGEVKTSFDGESSKTTFKKLKKVRIVDESLIPREFLVPDMKAISNAVIKNKIDVPGTEMYEQTSVVSKTR